ncbi:MAG: mechanosensitive ion channel family protein [Chloroflexia bacterium]|nr:mechanosensitive ion channel family protein [Chloroflexia bacterium]
MTATRSLSLLLHRSLAAIVCVGIIVVLHGGAPAGAQDDRATVRVDGRSVLRVGPTDELNAVDRARQIERRLATLLGAPGALGPAQVEPAGDERLVTVSGVPIVTVTESDADDNLSSVDAVAAQWAAAVDRALEQAAEARLAPGGRFVVEVRGAIEAALARLYESALRVIPRVLAALLVIVLFWGLASAVRWVMRFLFRHVVDDLTVENLIKQVAYYAVWIVGLIVAVDALGLDPGTVATGLGLTGLALGFALQDIISNFVSGLLILTMRPFELGDQIVVGETEGSVERIQLRASQIRTYDGRLVLVPNAEVFTARVTNNTASPVRRGSVEVHVGFDADLDQAQAVIREATRSAPGVLTDPPVSVRVQALGPDDVLLEARFWTDSRRSDFVATSSAVRQAILAALRASGVPLPDPSLHLLVPDDPRSIRDDQA